MSHLADEITNVLHQKGTLARALRNHACACGKLDDEYTGKPPCRYCDNRRTALQETGTEHITMRPATVTVDAFTTEDGKR